MSNDNQNTVSIPLSKQGKHRGKYQAIVDENDSDLATFDWHILKVANSTQYVARGMKVDGRRTVIILHQIILERKIGRPLRTGEFPDHINGDGLDNRRENLRVATRSQNNANRPLSKNNRTGLKGVTWQEDTQKYRARIMVNRKSIHLGHFDDPQQAHEAYCEAAREYHGEFARFE